MKNSFTIAQMARESGLSISTIRTYAQRQNWQGKQSGWKLTEREYYNHLQWFVTNLTFINPKAQERRAKYLDGIFGK